MMDVKMFCIFCCLLLIPSVLTEPATINVQPSTVSTLTNSLEVPRFILKNASTTFVPGATAHFTCMTTTSPPNGTVYHFWKDDDIVMKLTDYNHAIFQFKASDSADYACSLYLNGDEVKSANIISIIVVQTSTVSTLSHSLEVPHFILNNASTNFLPGATAHFTCMTTTSPPIGTVYHFWKGDDIVTKLTERNHTLFHLKPSDSGDYSCSIYFNEDEVKSPNKISIMVSRNSRQLESPRIVLNNASNHFQQGEKAHFTCNILTPLPPFSFYRFWKGDHLLVDTDNRSYIVHDLKPSNGGRYWCAINSLLGQTNSSNSINITINALSVPIQSPSIVLHNATENFLVSTTAHFSCESASTLPSDAFFQFWKGDNELIATRTNRHINIFNLKSYDSGEYWCSINSRQKGEIRSSNTITINISTTPPEFAQIILNNASTNFSQGSKAHFTCITSPELPLFAYYQFWKDRDILVAETTSRNLTINHLTPSDTGRYWCSFYSTKQERSLSSKTINITVSNSSNLTQNPRIILNNASTNFSPGSKAHFTCKSSIPLPPNSYYQFWRGDVLLAYIPIKNYTIPYLKSYHSGQYWCSIPINTGKIKSSNTIIINVSMSSSTNYSNKTTTITTVSNAMPRIVLHKPLSFYYEGAGAHLSCEAPGYDNGFFYEFTKNGKLVTQKKGKELTLYNLDVSDSGSYSCAVLLVYRKQYAWNSVYIEVRKYPGPSDKGEDMYGAAASILVSNHVLLASIVLLLVKASA